MNGGRQYDRAARVGRLVAYVESWNDGTGRYLSPIVHRGNLKRMGDIHDTPWCQAAVIEAYCDLEAAAPGRWKSPLAQAVRAQCGNQREDGSFENAGHEDDRFSSLVHNALASSALLRFCNLWSGLGAAGDEVMLRKQAFRCAAANLEYIHRVLWCERAGAARFDRHDYYTGTRDHFVLNMNAVLLEAIVGTCWIGPMPAASDEVVKAIVKFLRRSILDTPDRRVPYSNLRPDTEIHIYTALVGRGVVSVLEAARAFPDNPVLKAVEPECRSILGVCCEAIARGWDGIHSEYWHGSYGGRPVRGPIFLAGSGIIFDFLLRAAEYNADESEVHILRGRVEELITRFQCSSGGVENFAGYNSRDNFRMRDGGVVWEDVLPTPGWNAFLLRAAVRSLTHEERRRVEWPVRTNDVRAIRVGLRYFYAESARHLIVIGWCPLRSIGVYAYRKTRRRARAWWDLRRVRRLVDRGYYAN